MLNVHNITCVNLNNMFSESVLMDYFDPKFGVLMLNNERISPQENVTKKCFSPVIHLQ